MSAPTSATKRQITAQIVLAVLRRHPSRGPRSVNAIADLPGMAQLGVRLDVALRDLEAARLIERDLFGRVIVPPAEGEAAA